MTAKMSGNPRIIIIIITIIIIIIIIYNKNKIYSK